MHILSKTIWKQLNKVAFFLYLSLLIGCSKNSGYDIGAYKVDLANVKVENEVQYFILDNGEALRNSSSTANLETGERVWLNYSFTDKTTNNTIKVNGLTRVSQISLQATDISSISKMATNPVNLESAWISSHYLNMIFYIDYHSKQHSLGLFIDEKQTQEDNLVLFFKHDNNGDASGTQRKVICSFKLNGILGEPQQEKQITVNINCNNYKKQNFEMVY